MLRGHGGCRSKRIKASQVVETKGTMIQRQKNKTMGTAIPSIHNRCLSHDPLAVEFLVAAMLLATAQGLGATSLSNDGNLYLNHDPEKASSVLGDMYPRVSVGGATIFGSIGISWCSGSSPCSAASVPLSGGSFCG